MSKRLIIISITTVTVIIILLSTIFSIDYRFVKKVSIPKDVISSKDLIKLIFDEYPFLKGYKLQSFDMVLDESGKIINAEIPFYFTLCNPKSLLDDTITLQIDVKNGVIKHYSTMYFDNNNEYFDILSYPEDVAKYVVNKYELHDTNCEIHVGYESNGAIWYIIDIDGERLSTGWLRRSELLN